MSKKTGKTKKFIEPLLIKAGDDRLLLNGVPPIVDCRVVAEDNYQILKAENEKLNQQIERLRETENQDLKRLRERSIMISKLRTDKHELTKLLDTFIKYYNSDFFQVSATEQRVFSEWVATVNKCLNPSDG